MPEQKAADYRPHAVFLVAASALVLLFLASVFQLIVWELHTFYRSQGFGQFQTLPRLFFEMFGHRPECYLVAVIFWLWWPMVASLAYCHNRHRDPQAFATAFLYWFACCWVLAVLVLSFLALVSIYPVLMLLLSSLQSAPKYVRVVSIVSWVLPVLVLIFAIGCWLRFREKGPEQHQTPTREVKDG